MSINLVSNNQLTSFGSDSIAYIALCPDGTTSVNTGWKKFPCVINQKIDLEPKAGQLEDDRGRVVYSYSKPSKAKYSAAIFQRDAETFNFFRDNADETFLMWVVVGQIGNKNQEILMYGKFGGNYSEDMKADPNIPFEFNCEVNPEAITASNDEDGCFATSIILPKGDMIVKKDTPIPSMP